jgi:NitT/TauT family transport system ATP-binding protein
MEAMLAVRRLSKTYGQGAGAVTAIDGLELQVQRGEFVCIVGPSGCGKTTLLRCLSGLQPSTGGEVQLGERRVLAPPPEMALVFQDYRSSLMPWLTVRENVLLPLRSRKLSRSERETLIADSLRAVGLHDFGAHYPWQLSGGMQQRVAIARALAYRPEVLLMDEPFASVDAQTRADLEDMVLRIQRQYRMTVILVTHDVDEAVYLADRVIMLGPRPTRVKDELTITLPHERDQIATKELPAFARLRSQVFAAVRNTPAAVQAA